MIHCVVSLQFTSGQGWGDGQTPVAVVRGSVFILWAVTVIGGFLGA